MDKIKVIITNKQKDVKIPTGLRMLIRRCCNAVLQMEEFEGSVEVSVTLVNDKQIKELNAIYRNKDRVTDVLSFPMGENGKYDTDPTTGAKIRGDIVISMETAIEQAERFGHTLQREVGYLTAHSMLHLLGYDHEDNGLQRIRMREKEEKVMTLLGHLLGYDHEDNGLQRIRMREKEEKVMTLLGLPSSSSYVMKD